MKIGIIVYAYLLAEPLDRLLYSILRESTAHLYLFLHSQDEDVVRVCEKYVINSDFTHSIKYYPYGTNRGLSKSVNEAMLDGYQNDKMDVMLTANDDMLPSAWDIEKIATYAVNNRDCWIVEGMGITGNDATRKLVPWALAAVNPITFSTIGYWDENFFPAYYEDVDMKRRATLAGLKYGICEDTNITHQGSASLYSMKDTHEFDLAFDRTQSYYMQKWGGNVGAETFDRPFNDPALDLFISADNRHAPYGKHNRRDLEVTNDPHTTTA